MNISFVAEVERRRRKRKHARRVRRIVLASVLLLLAYFVIGATCPFWFPEETGATGSADLSHYFAEADGADRAAIIGDNVEALELRLQMIMAAEEEILLSTYQFKTGHAADALGLALLEAADRGVRVRILVDGLSGVLHLEGDPYFRALDAHPNIEIRIYNRFRFLLPWTYNGRLHDKIFLVDDLAYLVGGRNTCDRFLGDFGAKDESLDREIMVYNTAHGTENPSSVHALRAYFDSVWELEITEGLRRGGEGFSSAKREREYARIREAGGSLQVAPRAALDAHLEGITHPTDKITLISGETHRWGKEPLVFREMMELMLAAEERVVIQSPYVVLSKHMYRDVTRVASRLPEMVFVTNSIVNSDNWLTPADYLYHQDEILETGASILEWGGKNSTHAKTVLIDDSLVLLGSFNMDLRSAYMSTEIMLAIDSPELSAAVSEDMYSLASNLKEVGEGNTVRDTARDLPFGKQIFFYVMGIIVQPFRIEL